MSRADPAGAARAEAEPPDLDRDGGPLFDDDEELDAPLRRQSLPGALRGAAVDFYFQSIRIVPANVLWGVVLLVIGWVAVAVHLLAAFLLAPLLGLPMLGIYRLAGHVTRSQEAVLSDVVGAARQRPVVGLALGALTAWGITLLSINIGLGIGAGQPLGWAFATLAGWALVALVVFLVVLWPLAGDPDRRDVPLRETARLAGYVVIASPFRLTALAILIVVLVTISTIAFAALITITVGFVALLSGRMVLPDADRLAEHLAARDGVTR